MKEQWRSVPGFENIEVSDCGRVRNPKTGRMRKVTVWKCKSPGLRYGAVSAKRDDRHTTQTVHTLVALAFIGPRPVGAQVCHRNRDGLDNRLENLRYDTPKGNASDKYEHGTAGYGIRAPVAKLTEAQVIAIRRAYAAGGTTYKELAQRYGISLHHVGGIVKRRFWPHLLDDGSHLPREEWDAHRDHGSNRKRRELRLAALGTERTYAEWERKTGVPKRNIRLRIRAGWDPDEAVTKPVGPTGPKKQ